MKRILTFVLLAASLVLLLFADFLPQSAGRLGLVRNAEAIIGLPFTPFSFAGVARRSMYRHAVWGAAAASVAATNVAAANYAAAAANTAAAQAAAASAAASAAAAHRAAAALPIGSTVPYLPPNCTSSVINAVNYFNCAGVFYKAGFQGHHVVYIVSNP